MTPSSTWRIAADGAVTRTDRPGVGVQRFCSIGCWGAWRRRRVVS
jgi:hypothetical protein